MKLVRNEQSIDAAALREYETAVNYPTIAAPVRTEWRRDATLAPDLHPVRNAFIGAANVMAIVGTALWSATATSRTAWAILFALCIGAVAFLIFFVGLLWGQARLGIREYSSETPVVPETGRAMRIMAADPANPLSLTVAKYALSEGQMMRLAGALHRKGWKLDRNEVRAARVFPSGDFDGDNWTSVIKAEFVKAGLADENGLITQRGVALFESHVTPAPAQFDATHNPPPSRRQSDGAARGMGGDRAGGWGE
jgi:hypothetical protein